MPENTITVDQVKEVAEKQPEFKAAILSSFKDDFVKAPPADVVVRTKEEDQRFLDSHVSSVVEERVKKELPNKVGEQFGQAMAAIDQKIEEITGIKKLSAGEKTTDYARRAIEEKKAQGGDPVTKERVRQLEESLNTQKSEYERKLGEVNTQLFSREIDYQINSELDKSNIAVPMHLKTDEEKQSFIKQQKVLIKNGFLQSFQAKKDEQGNLVFYEGDKPQLSIKDGKPKTAGELITERFSFWFVPQAQVQTGTGSGGSSSATATIPAGGFKDKESVHKYLAASGLEAGSKEYLAELRKITEENKIAV